MLAIILHYFLANVISMARGLVWLGFFCYFLINWICYFNNFALLEVREVAMFQVYLNF